MQLKQPILVFNMDKLQFRPLSCVNTIIIHHTAGGKWQDAENIHQEHLCQGWAGIGYNYLIKYDGTVEKCRLNFCVGAHCSGHNYNSLGIALTGNFETEEPSKAQKTALCELIKRLKDSFPKIRTIKGHNAFNATACPGRFLDEYCKEAGLYEEN